MKLLVAFLLLSLTACNPESSPEGRSKIRDQHLEAKIDSMQKQNQVILDSLNSLSMQLKVLQKAK